MPDDMHGVQDKGRILDFLGRMFTQPPKVLLLEGGDAVKREQTALHWVSGINCTAQAKPCGSCLSCKRIADREFTDFFYLDGREGRIGIDAVRELRPTLSQAPRDGGRRVIIIGEAQELTPEAANALLKSMEDTDERNYFVLLVAQRERLLPTLVSRSWVLTLGWSTNPMSVVSGDSEGAGLDEWIEALVRFLQSGQGWFARTMVKAQVNKALTSMLIQSCRTSLIQAMHGTPKTPLARFFYEQGAPRLWRAMDLRMNRAEQGLMANVAPAVALDWMVAGLRMIVRKGA